MSVEQRVAHLLVWIRSVSDRLLKPERTSGASIRSGIGHSVRRPDTVAAQYPVTGRSVWSARHCVRPVRHCTATVSDRPDTVSCRPDIWPLCVRPAGYCTHTISGRPYIGSLSIRLAGHSVWPVGYWTTQYPAGWLQCPANQILDHVVSDWPTLVFTFFSYLD